MRGTLSQQETQDQQLMGRLDIAQKSADATHLNITLENLRKSTVARLEHMLTHGSIQHLFVNRGLMEYGLQNAAAIQLQCPNASRLFTRRQLAAAKLQWPHDIRPLTIYMPTLRRYFERGGEWLPSSMATGAEQRGIAMGSVPIREDIQYAANQVYDISQLPSAYQRNLMTQKEDLQYTYDSLCEYATAIKTEKGVAIRLQEKDMPGISIGSFYDAEQNTIFVSKSANPEHLTKNLPNSISEATVTLTSRQPIAIQQFETAMLSLQLQSYGGLVSSATDYARAADAFAMAGSFFDASHSFSKTMTALETSFARVDKMASFVHHHVSGIVASQDIAQEQTQTRTPSRTPGQSPQPGQTKQLANFLDEIH